MENLYERIRRIVETEWKSRLVISNLRKREWFYKDELERYLNLEHDIPVNRSSPVISKLKNAGVITYIDTRRGKIKCILGESTTKQGNLQSAKPIYGIPSTEITVGAAPNGVYLSNAHSVFSRRFCELYPQFDNTIKPTERRRIVRIEEIDDEIAIFIKKEK